MTEETIEHNQTGLEMLKRLDKFNTILDNPALTTDATEVIDVERKRLKAQFNAAANYTGQLAIELGMEFPNPLDGMESDTNPETLTPEELEFKESLKASFETSYGTYSSLLDAMNGSKDRSKRSSEKLEVASEQEAQTAIEALLTPGVIREAMSQIEEFSANPEDKSPEAGFDVVLIPNDDLTASDENAAAKHLQSLIPAWDGDDFVYEPLHNETTAHKAKPDVDNAVIAVLAPRHLNMRKGVVADQADRLDKIKADETSEAYLETADDITAITHATQLIAEGLIDTTSEGYKEERFWATYYKDVSAEPVDGCVPDSYVDDDGRFICYDSDARDGDPSRALVVPKLNT